MSKDEWLIERLKRSGPGGQHRNKRATGIRLTHVKTKTMVLATERRSQSQNLAEAFDRALEKISQKSKKKKVRIKTKPGKAARQRRLDSKKHRSDTKSNRRSKFD